MKRQTLKASASSEPDVASPAARLQPAPSAEAPVPLRASMGTRLRVPKTAEVVANLIRKRIVAGELKGGDYLPNEAQLMESLAISRPTLREAFRILETERLITVVRGSRTGALIHAPRIEAVARAAGFVLQAEPSHPGSIAP